MVDVTKIEKLMALMATHGFDVIQAESAEEKINLARNASQTAVFQPQNSPNKTPTPEIKTNSNPALEVRQENQVSTTNQNASNNTPQGETITSPFVGTFYRSPNPDLEPFVDIGTKIKKGQTLCIVEAMKLLNEIESDIDGEVVAILAENGKPVEFGSPLFIVAPSK
jgi:acetyl-CoA carboxylase biotin carboxyl carrier protein